MAYVRVWVHCVRGTKNRFPYLKDEIRTKVVEHIKENCKKKGIWLDTINGYHNHLHVLLSVNSEMSIAKAMQLIKGESSFWINKERMTVSKFEWADEYYAVSVSESDLGKVRSYICNQEEHHRKVQFSEEYEDFIKSCFTEAKAGI
jgi:putative transposase